MAVQKENTIKPIWRFSTGLLAVFALGLVALRLYSLSVLGLSEETGSGFLFILKIIFPLSLGLISGYIAITGKIPGLTDR